MTRGKEIWRVASAGIDLAGITDLALCFDTLYVATPQGLFEGSVKNQNFIYTDLDPKLINAPVKELSVRGSEVWLITDDGVEVYDQMTGKSNAWRAGTWMNGEEPSCICASGKFVWIGTRDHGFYRFNPARAEWIQYTTHDGLLNNHVQVIRRDEDDLLIGTATGLTRFYWNRAGATK
jgi:ligand-binding sensor domain-containing protein